MTPWGAVTGDPAAFAASSTARSRAGYGPTAAASIPEFGTFRTPPSV
jgi:hypothetical protein